MWHRAKFSHQSLICSLNSIMIPGWTRWPWYQIQHIMYYSLLMGLIPFLKCNQNHPHRFHLGSWLPLAVTKMIMHTIISLSLSLFLTLSLTLTLSLCLCLCICFSSPTGAFHIKHRHPSTLNCNVTPSLTHHPLCAPFKTLQKPYKLLYCVSLLYPLRSHAVCHSFRWFRHPWFSFYFSCALWFSVLLCLCNLHNFVFVFQWLC